MLDLRQVAAQMGEAGLREIERQRRVDAATGHALMQIRRFDSESWPAQIDRIRAARTSWLVAHSVAVPSSAVAAVAPPEEHVVVATDGSQVAPDRHEGVGGCYLLNVGRVFLPYCSSLRVRLDSIAEVTIAGDADEDEASSQLSQRRFGREMAALSGLIDEAHATGLPSVALMDGSLIAWFLDDKDGADTAKRDALQALKATLEHGRVQGVPIAGYVSCPGSRDVVNALRVTLCPLDTVACFPCPFPDDAVPCAPVELTTDARLFQGLLSKGERSPVFTAQGQVRGFSRILPKYGENQWIAFFYLNVGSEVARIEIPHWVADNDGYMSLVHAICMDQATKGKGYPVALAEAHECAVVRGADRDGFLNMVRQTMVKHDRPVTFSQKSLAKRARSV